MRQVNDIVLSGSSASASINGSQLDTNQQINMSFHLVNSNGSAEGTFKLQASNDVCQIGQQPNFVVSRWVDIPNKSTALTAGATQAILTLENAAYRWVRCVYTATTPAAGTTTVSRLSQSV